MGGATDSVLLVLCDWGVWVVALVVAVLRLLLRPLALLCSQLALLDVLHLNGALVLVVPLVAHPLGSADDREGEEEEGAKEGRRGRGEDGGCNSRQMPRPHAALDSNGRTAVEVEETTSTRRGDRVVEVSTEQWTRNALSE
jgi:hypothetical protein